MPVSRRTVLGGIGTIAMGAGIPQPASAQPAAAGDPQIRLRLLETSDLHMFALDWDYYHAKPDPTVGLSKVATLIRAARDQEKNSLLFDNGDIIQGNPLGDFQVKKPQNDVNPMIAAMNSLGYDCATLGNHEFNYGLDYLDRALAGAKFPFVCANLARANGQSYLPPSIILTRQFTDQNGAEHSLRIGVIGFVPPQIMIWDKSKLDGKVTTGDILASARALVPELRKNCDVLVALCHSGISTAKIIDGGENMSYHLAGIPGIDAIMTGHSHRVFPGPDYKDQSGVDSYRGTLQGVPAVMPGFWGSHLGVIDLVLKRTSQSWTVSDFKVEARPIYRREKEKLSSLADSDPVIVSVVAKAHQATMNWVEEPVGRLNTPIHSYFVFAGHDPGSRLVNAAQTWYAAELLKQTPYAGLPILSAAAPFRVGYTLDGFIDIAAGQIAIRDVADLYIYPNTVAAVKVTGAEVQEWLEYAARKFNRIERNTTSVQPLVDPQIPSYVFDQIEGVTYKIDVLQPSRYDRDGKIQNPVAHRIVDLQFAGKPIERTQEFVVITNNYRADGGGRFPGLSPEKVILRAPDANRDAVQSYVATTESISVRSGAPWSFAPVGAKISVSIESSPKAVPRLADIPGLRAAAITTQGMQMFEFDLL